VGATAFWKLISFASSILIAAYFGAGARTDVYFYLIMLIGLGVTFLHRMNTSVIIPEAMFLAEKNPPQSRHFLTFIFYLYILLALAICVVGIFLPVQTLCVFSRFEPIFLQQERVLLMVSFFLLASHILVYFLNAVAEMHKFFALAVLGPLNALCPLVCLLIWGRQIGLISMVYGFLAANVIQLFVLIWLVYTQLHWDFIPQPVHLHNRMKKNLLAGQFLAVLGLINSWLPVFLITGMGAGLISALNYCRQLTDSPNEIITNRVINVAKIEMTENAAKGQTNVFNKNYLSTNHLLLFILTPLAVFTSYFAVDIVGFIFEHGRFNAWNAADTVAYLRPLIFMVVLLVPAGLQSNTTVAWLKIKESFPYALISTLAFTVAVIVCLPRWGAFSYPYIALGEPLLGFILNYFLFRKYFPFVNYFRSFWELLRLLAINIIALLPAAVIKMCLANHNAGHFITLLCCGTVYMTVLLAISYKSKDLQLFFNTTQISKIVKKLM